MTPLLLESLEIRNFRAFRHLQIEQLARVNLIVGRNNVGKTSLLEALWLYARRGVPAVVWEQLAVRAESGGRRAPSIGAVRNAFHGRPDAIGNGAHLSIGPIDDPAHRLDVAIELHEDSSAQQRGLLPFYIVRWAEKNRLFTELFEPSLDIASLPTLANIPHAVVMSGGMAPEYIAALWDQIALTDLEGQVLPILRILVPDIERINMISDPAIGPQRIAMVRLPGSPQPLSLRSYGDGVARLFEFAVTALNARDGLLMIDEIENGIHYTALPQLWQHIFTLATRLNIQVFAATHSSDCVRAFEYAASEQDEDGRLIRLSRKNHDVAATSFDEEELAIIARDQIEVR